MQLVQVQGGGASPVMLQAGSCHAARAHLQQHVEHISVRLLHLVKQDDRVRPPPGERRGGGNGGRVSKGLSCSTGHAALRHGEAIILAKSPNYTSPHPAARTSGGTPSRT